MDLLNSAALLFRAISDAVNLDSAVWLILENNVADNVVLVYYGLEALFRRLAHSVTTYTLAIAVLTIATIPTFFISFPFSFMFGVYFLLMYPFTLISLGVLGPLHILVLPLQVWLNKRKIVTVGVHSFLDHYIDKPTRQLVGAISVRDNEPLYGNAVLRNSSRQIRILTIRAGHFSCPVECGLTVASLGSEDVDFEALSYVWGTDMFGPRILVNGIPVMVKPNLFQALRYLRRRDCDRRLWVDALCINQANDEERAGQVAQMGDIFRSARRVVVWLGINSPTIRVLFRKNNASESLEKQIHFGSSRAVSKALSVPWWTRIWVVQEVALAQNVVVQSGPECITWERFCTLVDYILQRNKFEDFNKNLYIPEYQSLRELRLKIRSESPHQCRPASRNLLRLIHDFRRREATIPDDKLFALYGLVDEEGDPAADDLRPQITYYDRRPNTDEWAVKEEFAARCIERFQDLSILALSEAFRPDWLSPSDKCPTWSPSWSSTPNDFLTTPFWLGCAGDTTFRWQRRFSASGGLPAPPCRTYDSSMEKKNQIRVRGWFVDVIDIFGVSSAPSFWGIMSLVLDGVSYRHILDVFRSMAQWPSALHQWKSMALQKCVNKDDALRRYHRTITAGLFDSIPTGEGGSYWEALDQVCPGKYFFVTRSGHFGLATAIVQPMQEVWVLMGSAVPMILNLKEQASSPLTTKGYDFDPGLPKAQNRGDRFYVYQHICQAYIHDLMVYDGNVGDDLRDGKLIVEDMYLG